MELVTDNSAPSGRNRHSLITCLNNCPYLRTAVIRVEIFECCPCGSPPPPPSDHTHLASIICEHVEIGESDEHEPHNGNRYRTFDWRLISGRHQSLPQWSRKKVYKFVDGSKTKPTSNV
jgi:hypothetical protein